MPLWRGQGMLYLYFLPDTLPDLIRTVAKLKTHTGNYANKHTVLFAYQIRLCSVQEMTPATCLKVCDSRSTFTFLKTDY
jgi:hypothetical protein